ncbi:biliverdin-producing heme oxygenase [Saccharibacillus alkalitolerans]|uniref:Biliverdin-producing heme oxygenase n=1 Tax=Saccharibacillus alkalitolerans TaxID=2705290 RepID=A0ABX0F9Q0_9BACL|nr:biliverdin-producing heme oxygenase [Saccharibacillus alkalitolerans]NGZ74742.1 biliverdin-producing heme oxygenase [Saccharibacillus alkalitolerans]
MTANILERLRNESAPYHDRVEANPYATAIMDGTIGLEEYKHYLERFYGFLFPLERLAESSEALSASGYDLEARRKTPMLEKDLDKLGVSAHDRGSLPLCEELPDLSTPAKLLGCFYVIEGSTMGGQMITKKLSQTLPVTPEAGLSYFNAYGGETRSRWTAFRERLLEADRSEELREEMTSSAIETFSLLERWLGGSPRP